MLTTAAQNEESLLSRYANGSDLCSEITIVARSIETLQSALDIFAREHDCCGGWAVTKQSTGDWLIFYWAMDHVEGATRFPFAALTNGPTIREFVLAWLGSVEYPPEPDHDGSNGNGYEITNIRQDWTEVFRIRPHWLEYHK